MKNTRFGFFAASVSLVLACVFAVQAHAIDEFQPSFTVGAGVRFGNEASADRAEAGYALAKANLLRLGSYNYLSIASPGIGVQTDGRFHFNIAPVSYSLNNGFTFGVDLIFPKNSEQNIFGVFVGFEFR